MKKRHKRTIKNTILKLIDFSFIFIYLCFFMCLANYLNNNKMGILETITLIYCLVLIANKYLKQVNKM